MFKSELIVTDSLGATTSLDLNSELPVSLNFNIADIKDPSKRDGSYSKTIKLYGTKTNNKFFEFMFEVNIATNKFNPNIKTPCVFYADSYEVLNGDLRLLNIQKIYKNGTQQIVYECAVFGQNSTLFTAINEGKLEDLDFSIYNHTFDFYRVTDTWYNYNQISGSTTSVVNGQGYRYPLANYGYNNFVANNFKVDWLRPGLFAKEYWDAIFAAAGKTYTSSFLTDTTKEFCKEVIPFNGENISLTASAKANFECYVGDTGLQSATVHPLTYGGLPGDWNHYSTWTTPILYPKWNTDSGGSFTDPGNVYNTTNGYFTVGAPGNYIISSALNFEIKFNYPATAVSNDIQAGTLYYIQLEKSTDGGVTWTIINTTTGNDAISVTNVYSQHSFNLTYPQMYMSTGEKFRISIRYVNTPFWSLKFYDAGSVPVTTGTASISTRLISTSTLKITMVDTMLQEGQPLVMSTIIPRDIKQKDFIMSYVRKYNLYIAEDKNKKDNYIIEPRDDFYALGTVKDWTSKWAIDQPTTIRPMGEIDTKEFIWTYKKDTDYYNNDYYTNYEEVYGTHKQVITNDFLKNTNKTEIIFSPTQIVDNPSNDLIIPYIFAYDGTVVKPMKHNIRSILWNGTKNITGTYTLTSIYGTFTLSFYPFCGMVNDPTNPTRSIEFGVPSKLYYTTSLYTVNNLFNTYYKKSVNEITDRDSKIVTMYLYLTAVDIATFEFYNAVFIDDTFYYVNKIIDYNPLVDGLTKVELLKLKTYNVWEAQNSESAFTITTNSLNQLSLAPFGESSNTNRVGQANNQMAGTNISSRSAGSILSGDTISIAESCYKINVVSSTNVVVQDNVSGFSAMNCSGIIQGASGYNNTLINCSGLTIEPSVFNYIGFGVTNKTITTSDNGKVEFGATATFFDGSSH